MIRPPLECKTSALPNELQPQTTPGVPSRRGAPGEPLYRFLLCRYCRRQHGRQRYMYPRIPWANEHHLHIRASSFLDKKGGYGGRMVSVLMALHIREGRRPVNFVEMKGVEPSASPVRTARSTR